MIYNGIDSEQYRPDPATDVLLRHGIDPERPSVVFVGRITRQKGVTYALDAALQFDPGAQFVLCAGAPDTPEIAAEIESKVERVRAERGNIVWIAEMLPRDDVVQILSHATVFLCPSIYEPLGIVNLEAMACETAVVATRTGGIPEVVEDGVTGCSSPSSRATTARATRSTRSASQRDIAERVNELLADPARAARMGEAGRAAQSSASPGRRSRTRPPRSTRRCSGTALRALCAHRGSDPQRAGLTPPVRSEEECMA